MGKLPRPTLKVKLPARPESGQVMRVVADWKTERQMSARVVQAILLYSDLLRGDTSRLRRAFPFLASALGGSGLGFGAPPAAADLKIVESADAATPADFGASLGLDDLEL
jgi:hypothetical protein